MLPAMALGCLFFGRAFHEADLLLGHLGGVFFAHGAAQHVGLREREAGELVRDLHDLLLIEHDAESLAQDRFELGEFVLDDAAAPLALDELVNHAALDGTRGDRGR